MVDPYIRNDDGALMVRRSSHQDASVLPAAYHEAGHVIGYCKLAYGVERATVTALGSGIVRPVGGFILHQSGVSLSSITPAPARSSIAVAARSDIVISFMGPFAEARYRKVPEMRVLADGGVVDTEQAVAVALWLASDDPLQAQSILSSARQSARYQVRKCWAEIGLVAARIAEVGTISGDDPVLQALAINRSPQGGRASASLSARPAE